MMLTFSWANRGEPMAKKSKKNGKKRK